MVDPSTLDERLTRLQELLEEALELACDADAPRHMEKIAKLCRDAAECAAG